MNTFIAIEKIDINPLSNLIFITDQQIVTSKGLILCNSSMAARQHENEVLRTCYDILRIPIVATTPEGIPPITQASSWKVEIISSSTTTCRCCRSETDPTWPLLIS